MPVYKTSNSGLLTRREYTSFLAGNEQFIPSFAVGAYDSIATVTVGSGGASSIDFTSIPSNYTHLQIRGILRASRNEGGDGLTLQFNGDTASNYSYHYLYGNGTSAFAGVWNQTRIPLEGMMPGATSGSNIFGTMVTDISDYTNTNKFTTVKNFGGNDRNGSGDIMFQSGNWRNTDAVTSIKLGALYGSGFLQYTEVSLYGIKGN